MMFNRPVLDTYINPFTDFGFKKLFGEECNKDILLDFLNELLHKEQGKIVSISYLNPEQLGLSEDYRKVVFDLYCENEKGEKFIVEMQKTTQPFFKERTLYYSTFPIIEQSKRGNWNFEMNAVYVIAILDFVFDENKNNLKKYRYDVKLTDIETHKVFYDKLTFIYLEMPKFKKTVDELETRFEKWMYVIRNLECLDELPDKLRERIFEKIFTAAEVAKLSRQDYYHYVRDFNNWENSINCYDHAVSKATKEGTAKGMAKGMVKGMAKGREEEKVKMVLNCHKAGIPVATITELTGFTPEKIVKILKG
jgi:predicted transposase/invertase (TIGR01784 family)